MRLILILASAAALFGQPSYPPPNQGPNPYRNVPNWAQLPDGRKWGSTSGITVAPDGNIWAIDRCGAGSCDGSPLEAVLEFDPSGRLLKNFGAGMFAQPHGIFVDQSGNVWVTDARTTKDGKKGLYVVKFSPEGKVLMTLGKPGVSGLGPDIFGAPTAAITSANGDIFVADGHHDCFCSNARIVKFDKNGKYLTEWGGQGNGPGQLDGPHALAFDSQGRLFVADRQNSRVSIFTQDGKLIAEWKQFGRPSGLYIDQNDMLYVSDSDSTDEVAYGYNPGVRRGIRIGSVKDGKVIAFLPEPEPEDGSNSSEGVAVDHSGAVYREKVGPRAAKREVLKYVKDKP